MEQIYNTSVSEINRLALSGKKFSAEQAGREIVKKGGILRVTMGVTLREYFQEMVEKGFFLLAGFDTNETLYLATEKFLRFAKELPHCVEKGLKIDTYEILLNLLELGKLCKSLKTEQNNH